MTVRLATITLKARSSERQKFVECRRRMLNARSLAVSQQQWATVSRWLKAVTAPSGRRRCLSGGPNRHFPSAGRGISHSAEQVRAPGHTTKVAVVLVDDQTTRVRVNVAFSWQLARRSAVRRSPIVRHRTVIDL